MKRSMDEGDDSANIISHNLVDAGANDKDKAGSSSVKSTNKSSNPLSTILASDAASSSDTNHHADPHAGDGAVVTKVC